MFRSDIPIFTSVTMSPRPTSATETSEPMGKPLVFINSLMRILFLVLNFVVKSRVLVKKIFRSRTNIHWSSEKKKKKKTVKTSLRQ